MHKNTAIVSALDYLRRQLGNGYFQLADHWEGDLRAVGIVHPTDPTHLVYIACGDGASPSYTAILERRAATDIGPPYEECGRFNDLGLADLASVVAAHLQSRPA
ncbi:hypothetical protein [Taklimakanibacter albus]|uniref:Uncharacterized protein n=1 Tax=Taklimakanibacter albus TaxID=2800327 RepID=A0ACC5R252_9HYPH|nr:hypothetical protein [Aestuariivirga sp. YIM B02566]MBK1866483.1 hypothetical protein [Aestuariivirga sp. YIM B02566]